MSMTPEDFREMCNAIGIDEITQLIDPSELPEDAESDRVPLEAETEAGDTINYHLSTNGNGWVVSFTLDRYTIDSNEFSMSDVTVDGDELVVSGVSGTRPSEGYGVAGFNRGEIRVTNQGVSLLERH